MNISYLTVPGEEGLLLPTGVYRDVLTYDIPQIKLVAVFDPAYQELADQLLTLLNKV